VIPNRIKKDAGFTRLRDIPKDNYQNTGKLNDRLERKIIILAAKDAGDDVVAGVKPRIDFEVLIA